MNQIRLSITQTNDTVTISIPKELIELSKHDDVNFNITINESTQDGFRISKSKEEED